VELQVTLSDSSLKALIASVNTEVQQPGVFAETSNLAASIMDHPTYGNALVNAIVDQHEARLAPAIAEQLSLRHVAAEIDTRDVAEYVSVDVQEVADRIDLSDLASNIDMSDLAENISVEASEVADHIDTGDLADSVAQAMDLEEVAQHVSMTQLSAKMVHHFVNNAEFRACFMDELLERLSKASA
jgi:hypothetical protein